MSRCWKCLLFCTHLSVRQASLYVSCLFMSVVSSSANNTDMTSLAGPDEICLVQKDTNLAFPCRSIWPFLLPHYLLHTSWVLSCTSPVIAFVKLHAFLLWLQFISVLTKLSTLFCRHVQGKHDISLSKHDKIYITKETGSRLILWLMILHTFESSDNVHVFLTLPVMYLMLSFWHENPSKAAAFSCKVKGYSF